MIANLVVKSVIITVIYRVDGEKDAQVQTYLCKVTVKKRTQINEMETKRNARER